MTGNYREVVGRLQGAQKSSKGAPGYSRFVNRPVGRRLAAMAYLMGAKPDQVTAFSAVATVTGLIAIVALPVSVWSGAVIALLLCFGYALDSADGQLARLRGGGSLSGEWLDHMVDSFKVATIHLTVLAVWSRSMPREWLLVPLIFTVVATVSFFAQLLNEQLRNNHTKKSAVTPVAPSSSVMRSLVALPTDYGFLCLIFLLWGSSLGFQVAYTVAAAGSTGYLLLALVKWHADMKKLDEGVATQ